MGVLATIERRLQGVVEGTFARLFGGTVTPSEVASALKSQVASHTERRAGRIVVPNRYRVELGPSDRAEVGDDSARVARAFTDMLSDYVDAHGWRTFADVHVSFEESSALHTGQFRVRSQYDSDIGRRDRAPGAGNVRRRRSGGGCMSSGDDGYDAARDEPVPPSVPVPGFGNPAGAAYHAPAANPQYPQHQYPQHQPPAPWAQYPPPSSAPPAPPAPPAPLALAPRLDLTDGTDRSHILQRGSNIVGRGQTAALRLADTAVSREHADVYFDGRNAIVHDLGSTNGTAVNGSDIQTWQLSDGDIIWVGRSEIVFRTR